VPQSLLGVQELTFATRTVATVRRSRCSVTPPCPGSRANREKACPSAPQVSRPTPLSGANSHAEPPWSGWRAWDWASACCHSSAVALPIVSRRDRPVLLVVMTSADTARSRCSTRSCSRYSAARRVHRAALRCRPPAAAAAADGPAATAGRGPLPAWTAPSARHRRRPAGAAGRHRVRRRAAVRAEPARACPAAGVRRAAALQTPSRCPQGADLQRDGAGWDARSSPATHRGADHQRSDRRWGPPSQPRPHQATHAQPVALPGRGLSVVLAGKPRGKQLRDRPQRLLPALAQRGGLGGQQHPATFGLARSPWTVTECWAASPVTGSGPTLTLISQTPVLRCRRVPAPRLIPTACGSL